MAEQFYATGKRKSSVARVWLSEGTGVVTVNNRPLEEYFPREISKILVRQPFTVAHMLGKFDVRSTVKGGGLSGQASAIRHGIAKALQQQDPGLRPVLKKAGLLTRDPREKERKKYGQRGARARFQFSKR